MLFQHLVSTFNETYKKKSTLSKIAPKIDEEHKQETNTNIIKRKTINQKCTYPDLELGFGPIVEETYDNKDIIIDIQGFTQHQFLDNFVSFIESINYLSASSHNKNSYEPNCLIILEEETLNEIQCQDKIYAIDIPLHLPVNNL